MTQSHTDKRRTRWLLAAGALWATTIWVWPRSTETEPVSAPRNPTMTENLFRSTLTDAQFGILGFHLYETKDGRRYWNIESQFAELYRESNQTLMRKVTAEFFSQTSDNVVTTRGDQGRSEMVKRVVVLEGNVFVSSERGYEFTLDQVTYLGKTHELQSESAVSMKGPDPEDPTLYLKGVGLQAFINEEFYRVKKNVRGRKRLSDQRWLHIASVSGEFFPDVERARFYGRVRSSIQDLEIDSERLELATTQGEETLIAEGRVQVRSKGRIATANKAALKVGSNQLILEGRARVDAKDDRIEGTRIVLYTDDDRVEVTSAKGKIEGDT